jgi:hypothetical protein
MRATGVRLGWIDTAPDHVYRAGRERRDWTSRVRFPDTRVAPSQMSSIPVISSAPGSLMIFSPLR